MSYGFGDVYSYFSLKDGYSYFSLKDVNLSSFKKYHFLNELQCIHLKLYLILFILSDWKARADVVKLLKHLKKELTVLVVSHDLRLFQFILLSYII